MKLKEIISGFRWVKLGFLFSFALIISIFGVFPQLVEQYYATGIYPAISNTQRTITRWIPFSLGDLIYLIFFISLIVSIISGISLVIRKKVTKVRLIEFFFRFISFFLWLFIVFKLLWGLNYDRMGIAYQLRITPPKYTKEEVTELTHTLIDRMNECRRQIKDTVLPQPALDSIYIEAFRSYRTVSFDYEFLNYHNRSVKESMFTGLGDYMGFTGYYNPFTGEAQLRSDIPRVMVPYIACHEMAHQLGYASESEANFVGYLAAVASKNVYFRYSVYLDLFSYAQSEQIYLYSKEKDFKQFESIIKENRGCVDSLVRKDRREIREFFQKRRNKISPAVSSLYDQYLKMNKQTQGIESYNEVVGWLLAYQKKYGKL